MPEYSTIAIKEAQLRTTSGRQGKFISEYADYIQQLPPDQAGRLRAGEGEKHPTIRRRLVTAAKALGINIIIKRSGNDLYFWRGDGEDEQRRSTRRYTRRTRTGSPGSLIPPATFITEPVETGEQEGAEEETTPLDQSFTAVE